MKKIGLPCHKCGKLIPIEKVEMNRERFEDYYTTPCCHCGATVGWHFPREYVVDADDKIVEKI